MADVFSTDDFKDRGGTIKEFSSGGLSAVGSEKKILVPGIISKTLAEPRSGAADGFAISASALKLLRSETTFSLNDFIWWGYRLAKITARVKPSTKAVTLGLLVFSSMSL